MQPGTTAPMQGASGDRGAGRAQAIRAQWQEWPGDGAHLCGDRPSILLHSKACRISCILLGGYQHEPSPWLECLSHESSPMKLSYARQVGALANAVGIGGGAFYVPLFNILLGFSLKGSTALSQAVRTPQPAA